MDLREIGAMLRAERERQGLSIDDVSETIKITRTCLAAIEEGNQSLLPHPVYAKGFIKNYAKLLGFDQEVFHKGLAEAYHVDETPLRDTPVLQDLPDDDCGCQRTTGVRLRSGRIALVVALLVVLAGAGWYAYSHFVAKSPDAVETAAPVAEVAPAPTVATPTSPDTAAVEPAVAPPVATVPTVPPTVPSPDEPTPAAQTPVTTVKPEAAKPGPGLSAPSVARSEPTAEDKATQAIATSGPATPGAPAVPPTPDTPVAPAPGARSFTVGEQGSHVVTIAARERCWVQAGADGGTMHESMLEKGDVFTGRFADYLLVRLGNAGAVDIRFDNKLYPLQATKGSVKTLKFVAKKPDGEKPAAQAAPAAPVAQTQNVTPAQAPAAAPTENASAASVPASAKEVEIYGQDGSWVSVHPDKGPAKDVYVKKGQRITVPFDEKLEIKLGNPSNVIFRYDGKETPVTTERGGSKTVRFP